MAVVEFSAKEINFSFFHVVQIGSAAHRASYTMGTGGYFSKIKRPGREADRLPSSDAEVNNGGAIPPFPQISSWRGTYLIEYRDNFMFPSLSLSEIRTWLSGKPCSIFIQKQRV
jgi:hypothetical protein